MCVIPNQDLGYRTISFAAKADNPLETLAILSEDFPKFAHHLVSEKFDNAFLKSMEEFTATFVGTDQQFFLNGIDLKPKRLNAFEYLHDNLESFAS
jgi:UDP-glucose:glycoprotein glucosyltransferase